MDLQQSKPAIYEFLKTWYIHHNAIGHVDVVATSQECERIVQWANQNLSTKFVYSYGATTYTTKMFISDILKSTEKTKYDPVLLSLIRRTLPNLVAAQLIGVETKSACKFFFMDIDDFIRFKLMWT